jgi:hypothetical protein
LKVVAVPTIANFEMQLNYRCTWIESRVVNGTGNAIIPEGTKVTWKVSALALRRTFIGRMKPLVFSLKKLICFVV